MGKPTSIRLMESPVIEKTSLNGALAIVKSLYGSERKYPWTLSLLEEVISLGEGGTGNVWFDGKYLWVWQGYIFYRKYPPKRCLQIIEQ